MHRPCVTSGMDIKMSPKAERALPSHRNGKTHGPSHVHKDAEMRKDFILGDAKFLESCGLRAFAPLDTEAPFARFKLAIFSEALIKTVSLCYMSRLFNQMHCDTTVTIRRLSLELCLFFFFTYSTCEPCQLEQSEGRPLTQFLRFLVSYNNICKGILYKPHPRTLKKLFDDKVSLKSNVGLPEHSFSKKNDDE